MLRTTVGTLVLAASAGLAGCAAPALSVKYPYAPEAVASPLGFTVVDRRPPSESESEILSYNISNDLYGITRLGDTQVTPNRVPYLMSRLKDTAGDRLNGSTVTIEHFTIHLNMQATYRKVAVGAAVGGVASGALGSAIGAVIQSDMDPTRPFVDTELKLLVGSQPVSSRQRVNLGSGSVNPAIASAIKASLDAAAGDIGAKLNP